MDKGAACIPIWNDSIDKIKKMVRIIDMEIVVVVWAPFRRNSDMIAVVKWKGYERPINFF